MDKETLSNYGWIVILVLVLAVLLALATPFGNFVAEGFKATYAGFGMVGDNALGVVIPGSETSEELPEESIPVKDPALNPDDGTGVYDGMIYTYGNYEYRYNEYYDCYGDMDWSADELQNGWGVKCIKNVADPGPILESINGNPITNMYCTFYNCNALTVAPSIPSSVTNIDGAFSGCKSLTDISNLIIPSGVTSLYCTFWHCNALTIAPEIPNGVTRMVETFDRCASLTTVPAIPSSITVMAGAFANCTALTTINFNGTQEQWNAIGCTVPNGATVICTAE